MSGLESIALAVAHLEEQREQEKEEPLGNQLNPRLLVSDASAALTCPPPPLPRALHMDPARVVSTDERTSSSSSSEGISTFGYILADPIAWLKKTQDRPPLRHPSDTVHKVEPTDVLCGRGGETNHHPGNIQYRLLVKAFQPLYVSAKRREKPLIAQCIVYSVRQVGGRFLKRLNEKEWQDVGNTKAREKTSQALREGAPELRGETVQKLKKQMLAPAAPPPPPPAITYGQMASVEATLLSAFLTPLQQALSRSVAVTSPTQLPVESSTAVPLTAASATAAATATSTAAQNNAADCRKRPTIISDGNSDSESSSNSSGQGGPRLKRFKKRFQQESSSM
jgi:hypothetical protein